MRMHRGSSKDVRGLPPTTGSLPLSASPPSEVRVVLEVMRAGGTERREVLLPVGTPLRGALRQVGLTPEGSAVLLEGTSVPLDLPIERPARFTVVPTFSGG